MFPLWLISWVLRRTVEHQFKNNGGKNGKQRGNYNNKPRTKQPWFWAWMRQVFRLYSSKHSHSWTIQCINKATFITQEYIECCLNIRTRVKRFKVHFLCSTLKREHPSHSRVSPVLFFTMVDRTFKLNKLTIFSE